MKANEEPRAREEKAEVLNERPTKATKEELARVSGGWDLPPRPFKVKVRSSGKGHIEPQGSFDVGFGGSITFQIIPDSDCRFMTLYVNGYMREPTTEYTFHNVRRDEELIVIFG